MTQVETLERKIARLSSPELSEFREWFIEFDAQQWDQQLKEDSTAGALDGLAASALESLRAGTCTKL